MLFKELHPWDLTPTKAVALQKELAGQVSLTNAFPVNLQTVAGVDVSYRIHGKRFHAAVVVMDYLSMEILETVSASGEINFPYVPGLLSFRELPILLQAFRDVDIVPDLILADAQGIAHPRRLGLASHLGLWLDLPTIGCAKSRLCGTSAGVDTNRGEWSPLSVEGEVIGRVVRTKQGVKPLYVSPGHKINVKAAADIALACCRGYRLPEPTRQAHLLSNRVRAEDEAGGQ